MAKRKAQVLAMSPTAAAAANQMEVEKVELVPELGSQWADLDRLLLRDSSFGSETGKLPLGEFEAGQDTKEFLASDECKVLVIGAGGLGCEILKDLALSGFKDITVVDLDTIDLSNLNRQFLFRHSDVGRPKATAAAEFVMSRCPGVTVTSHHCCIQDFPPDFYQQFTLIVSGLDNIEARRWLNSTLCSLVEVDDNGKPDMSTIIPFIDGGTEGLKGQARVILPRVTSCFECSLDMFPPQKAYPMCTIADTPRLPEHCISYASLLQWPQAFPDRKLDTDNPEDIRWVYERAAERAEQHKIAGVTYMLTMGVVKNIIPAVASTNAIIAAACVNEALKLVTYAGQTLNTYLMYMGSQGVYSQTFEVAQVAGCIVCGSQHRTFEIPSTTTLRSFIEDILMGGDVRASKPSVTAVKSVLFMQKPPALRKQTEGNLDKALGELCPNGDELTVTDPAWSGGALMVTLRFTAAA